ncbi:MAG: hypothetical protein GXO16_05495 [Epsilonproteobacteria bacterium]|nr:hypothetical protein [Campylobacterota bacterium]
MKNESIAIAINHLDLAKSEITECATSIYKKIESILQSVSEESIARELSQALAALQTQDIVTQRLEKLKEFFQLLDERIDFAPSKEYLEEFAWENEVDQDDIDAMIDGYKG